MLFLIFPFHHDDDFVIYPVLNPQGKSGFSRKVALTIRRVRKSGKKKQKNSIEEENRKKKTIPFCKGGQRFGSKGQIHKKTSEKVRRCVIESDKYIFRQKEEIRCRRFKRPKKGPICQNPVKTEGFGAFSSTFAGKIAGNFGRC